MVIHLKQYIVTADEEIVGGAGQWENETQAYSLHRRNREGKTPTALGGDVGVMERKCTPVIV